MSNSQRFYIQTQITTGCPTIVTCNDRHTGQLRFQIRGTDALQVFQLYVQNTLPEALSLLGRTSVKFVVESILCFTGGRPWFVDTAYHTQYRLFHLSPFVLLIKQPANRSIEILQCRFEPGIPVGEKAKRRIIRIMACTTAVGTALFANGPMQIPVAQETREHGQGRSIRMLHRNRRIRLSVPRVRG